MNVSSLLFLGFSIFAACLHGAWSNQTWRKLVMLVANLAFLASFTHAPHALLPLGAFLLLGYVAVFSTRFTGGGVAPVAFVVGTVLLFSWLKQYWFLSFLGFLPFAYLTIGLSYVFFRVLGMIVDAGNDPALARVGPVTYLNFAVNFPTLVAGPIDRFQDFSGQNHPVTTAVVGKALERITLGFFKVLVLSAIVLRWQASATGLMLSLHNGGSIRQAVISFGLYPIFLYFNFSGYTDIVIGTGYLFGKVYPENFNAPFSADNFIDFWSRWHMSLSFWLRDYLYTPLLKRLMQMEMPRSFDPYLGVFSFFVTFFVIGVWHGSTVIFAVYGLLLGLGVSVNKLYQVYMTKRLGRKRYNLLAANQAYSFLCRGLTYTWYCFCMICFWNSGAVALQIMAILRVSGFAAAFLALLFLAVVLLNLFEILLVALRSHLTFSLLDGFAPYARAVVVGVLILGCVVHAILTQQVNAQIIYQAF